VASQRERLLGVAGLLRRRRRLGAVGKLAYFVHGEHSADGVVEPVPHGDLSAVTHANPLAMGHLLGVAGAVGVGQAEDVPDAGAEKLPGS